MNKLLKSKTFVFQERSVQKTVKGEQFLVKDNPILVTIQIGDVTPGTPSVLVGRPMGLLLALTYAA